MMKKTPNDDCSKLLKAFKKRRAEFSAKAKALQVGAVGPYNANQRAYEKWIKDNITSRGLGYIFDQRSGEPTAIFKILAGKSAKAIAYPPCF